MAQVAWCDSIACRRNVEIFQTDGRKGTVIPLRSFVTKLGTCYTYCGSRYEAIVYEKRFCLEL